MNTTKATPDHHKCEFAAFRLSKFFSPSAAGVWGHRSPRAFGSFWPLQKELAARRNLALPRLLAKASACLLKTTPTYFGEPSFLIIKNKRARICPKIWGWGRTGDNSKVAETIQRLQVKISAVVAGIINNHVFMDRSNLQSCQAGL